MGDDDNNFIPTITNYYDDYSFPGNIFGLPINQESNNVRGLLTATILGTATSGDGVSNYLSVNYYDSRGRIIRIKSQNHLSGTDQVDNTYSFVGELLTSTRTHIVGGQLQILLSMNEA
ncbi:hypothetical protein [Pedobacter glucosidilyticus]|uniref:hypothetical protein n=1 Tax=Pedobacter glucosidilyticus TaxID=1122941 RepID=UPI00047CCBFF|nr:hypothetical protein [Pedobacter glucosidilyticus]